MSSQSLIACGVAAGPLFTATYLLTGAIRADYKSLRHPVSSLALGSAGWTQTVNFLCGGGLSMAFAVGLWRAGVSHWGAVLVGVWAIGLIGAGLFRTDPVRGYPPGTPDQLDRPSPVGAVHDLVSLVAFLGLTAACLVLASQGSTAWAVYSIASGVLFAATMVLATVAFGHGRRLAGVGGLLQRASISIGWLWLTLLALRTLPT
ncbi:DUF998 domain-containing protein [Streptomyces sp. NPDC026672]|uniref:DUF998 domain-containing protein n=1 Tax=unclassified Streptomyces TaxID=2593676 RepID=UPI0033EF9019